MNESNNNGGIVYVDAYDRDNGHVQAHTRSAPGNGSYKLGTLSAEFESKRDPRAIGYDSDGGYSYGSYQISSNKETMRKYLEYMKNNPQYRQYAIELEKYGFHEAAKAGDFSFQDKWVELTKYEGFNESQHNFIVDSHYKPLINKVSNIYGLDLENRHPVIKDILFSMSVQHRKAADIVKRALGMDASLLTDEEMVNKLYEQRVTYVSGHSLENSLVNRYCQEKVKALEWLRGSQY